MEWRDPAGWLDDDGEELLPHEMVGVTPMPLDARRLGFDRWSDDGALIAMAAALDPAKRSHKVVAWLMLLAMVAPVLATLAHELL